MKEKAWILQEKRFKVGGKVSCWTVRSLLWYWFVNIEGIGIAVCWKLLDYFSDVFAIWEADSKELKELLTPGQIRSLDKSKMFFDPDASIRRLMESEIRFIHWDMEEYPEKLRHIFQPPLGLYVRGKLPDPDRPSLAMVGSRRATNYGKILARDIACQLAGAGVQIISGLASGIDAESHRGALLGGGYTLGVLGGGIDTIYPKGNFNLYYEMYACGGVVSEYNIGIPNISGLFPMRNRIISGLSDAVLVVEAGKKSGSLITADQGLEQGREIFALPGRVTDSMSSGCNDLIAQGAIPVTGPQVLLDYFHIKREERLREENRTSVDKKKEAAKGKAIKKEAGKGEAVKGETANREAGRGEDDLNDEMRNVLDRIDVIQGISFDSLYSECGIDKKKLELILYQLECKELIFQPVQGLFQRRTVII